MADNELSDEDLQTVYCWVDSIQLSRPKRNISRDFADGVLAAEVVHSYLPRIVELHNYSAANSVTQKQYNWKTLNDKVFRRFGYQLTNDDIEQIVRARPGVIERTLLNMRTKLENAKNRTGSARSASNVRSAGGKRNNDASSKTSTRQRAAAPGGRRNGRGQPKQRQQQREPQQQQQQQQRQPQQQQFSQQIDYGMQQQQQPAYHNTNGNEQYPSTMQKEVDQEMLEEKEQEVQELRETIDILELKVKKLEQLVRLKDSKIQALTSKMM